MTKLIDIEGILALAVVSVRRRFSSYVERDDLISESRLWMYEHPRLINEYLMDENYERACYRLRRDLVRCMELYARREKAQKLGYDPEDEQFYSAVLVGALLPAVVLEEWEPPPIEPDGSRAVSDPAEGGLWQTARADVAKAWARAAPAMADDMRAALVAYYVDGYSQTEVGAMLGIEQSAVSRKLKRGIRKVVNELGGEKPRGCPYDCECHDLLLRRRPGTISNRSGDNQV